MARKKLVYMIVDTETATLPFANEVAENNPEKKKKIAIARPLVYDVGWAMMYRDGTVFDKKQFLVAETFSVPAVFNTAYYAEKRPLYLGMLMRGEIEVKPWREIMEIFTADLNNCDFVGAFNSAFDFKKAIPFTELYINKLYSASYYAWEEAQKKLCYKIANEKPKKNSNKDYDAENFEFRGEKYPLFDIWGMACDTLLNTVSYKEMCLDYGMLTTSGEFFKSSAETTYRYLLEKYDFEEAHTALADAEIESFILAKILKKQAVTVGIKAFPFRDLGYTFDFVIDCKRKKADRARAVYNQMLEYLGGEIPDYGEMSNYQKRIYSKMIIMEGLMGE